MKRLKNLGMKYCNVVSDPRSCMILLLFDSIQMNVGYSQKITCRCINAYLLKYETVDARRIAAVYSPTDYEPKLYSVIIQRAANLGLVNFSHVEKKPRRCVCQSLRPVKACVRSSS
jgi:hypothetical protein